VATHLRFFYVKRNKRNTRRPRLPSRMLCGDQVQVQVQVKVQTRVHSGSGPPVGSASDADPLLPMLLPEATKMTGRKSWNRKIINNGARRIGRHMVVLHVASTAAAAHNDCGQLTTKVLTFSWKVSTIETEAPRTLKWSSAQRRMPTTMNDNDAFIMGGYDFTKVARTRSSRLHTYPGVRATCSPSLYLVSRSIPVVAVTHSFGMTLQPRLLNWQCTSATVVILGGFNRNHDIYSISSTSTPT